MPEPKYTPDGLPVVSEETLIAMDDLFNKKEDKNKDIGSFRKYLQKENPNLVSLMDGFVNCQVGSVDFLYGFINGMIVMYESLRRQSGANKLEREVEGK